MTPAQRDVGLVRDSDLALPEHLGTHPVRSQCVLLKGLADLKAHKLLPIPDCEHLIFTKSWE